MWGGHTPHWLKLSLATLGLVVIGGIFAPSTIHLDAILSMLPFMAILALASIGQHLVMQQRGFDLSVAGAISLSCVLVTVLPTGGNAVLVAIGSVLVTLIVGTAGGAVNGIAVSYLRIPPLVTTLGINALLFAVALVVSGGSPHVAPKALMAVAQGHPLVIPNTVIVMLILAALVALVIQRTPFGRRFIAVGSNPGAARAVGVPIALYGIFTFMFAGFCYAAAGVLLAGFIQSPSVTSGNPYVLATIAAVAVGGNATIERRASFAATVIGTFLLTYLGQLVVSLGFDKSLQYVVQAIIVIASVGLPDASKYLALPRFGLKTETKAEAPALAAGRQLSRAAGLVPVLELIGIRKSFGSVNALKSVTVDILPGEVHAIVGENGAGKSTLISIAGGTLKADSGEVRCEGKRVDNPSPAMMRDLGIAVAYQHPALAPDLTVLENIQLFLNAPGSNGGREQAERWLDAVAYDHLQVPLTRRVADLSLAQRHVVEIARALATSPRILFLDEPTEPFQRDDVRRLFELIRELKARNIAVVYVSHRLHEVMEIADRISVMRDGELIDTRLRADITNTEIVTLIAGKPLAQIFPRKSGEAGPEILRVSALCGPGFSNVDLIARHGEILGLTGVEGQGHREFLRAVAGINRYDTGTVEVIGRRVETGPNGARRAGIGFIPDDRHREGLFLSLTIRENIGFAAMSQFTTAGLISLGREAEVTRATANDFEVKAPSIDTLVSNLSGGNQQKVLFGREVLTMPKVLLVDEPTRGIDIGTRTEIYRRLRAISDSGVGVVVCSSDGTEVEGLCDRVVVFARGSAVRELVGDEVADATITEANMTGTAMRAAEGSIAHGHSKWYRFLASDHFPGLALVALSLVIALGTNIVNAYFLTPFNISNMMTLTAMLAFVSAGQLCTVLLGGIDLAVGPLAGLGVVLASFLITPHETLLSLIGGSALIIAFCTLYGLLQAAVIVGFRMPSVVVTLASFIGLQGVSLILRPNAGGIIDSQLSDITTYSLGGVPAGMVLALVAFGGLEWLLYRSRVGRQLRAFGSNGAAARKLGARSGRATFIAFGASGFLTGFGALMLAAQVGIGSPVTGIDFTLMSITAVVLGGSAIAGGRGSFLCTLIGAALTQLMLSASTFLQAGPAWQYGLIGVTTLIAAGLFSTLRPHAAR